MTTKKNIIIITTGEIILPNSKPNLNHALFSGFNNFELIAPNTKKISEIIRDHILILSLLING